MERVLSAYSNEHIKAYTKTVIENGIEEHGYPRLTANLGILIAHNRKTELKNEFCKMMDICCREIPTALEKNGWKAGNDFSVKEIVFCLLEIEKAGIFDKSVTDGWRKDLSEKNAVVSYKGNQCIYSTNGIITDMDQMYANRNGHYRAMAATGTDDVSLKIELF